MAQLGVDTFTAASQQGSNLVGASDQRNSTVLVEITGPATVFTYQLIGWVTSAGQTLAEAGGAGFVVALSPLNAPNTPATTATVKGIYKADISGLSIVQGTTTSATFTGASITVTYSSVSTSG